MRLLLIFCSLIAISRVFAQQILDDSTQLVYGPTTSKYTMESRILWDDTTMSTMDTAIHGFESKLFQEATNYRYQDLGNNGTAVFSLNYDLPKHTGLQSGYNAYDLYHKSADKFVYYNTKSPLFDVQAMFGGDGRSNVDFVFSRNVNYRWNVGFTINRMISDQQVGAAVSRGDRNLESSHFDLYTFYKDSLDKYTLLAHFSRFQHGVNENGGINTYRNENPRPFVVRDDENVVLSNAQFIDNRFNIHLYQEYKVAKQFKGYWIFDRNRQRISYQDGIDTTNAAFYGDVNLRNDSIINRFTFREIRNEIGIKGLIGPVYYAGYLKRRDFNISSGLRNPYVDPASGDPLSSFGSETYIGGRAKLKLKEFVTLKGQLEIDPENGNSDLSAALTNRFLKGNFRFMTYSPNVLHQYYFDNNRQWNNTGFDQTTATSLDVSAPLEYKSIALEPYFMQKIYSKYVYMGPNREPVQDDKPRTLNWFGVKSHVGYKDKIFLETNIQYNFSLNEDDSFLRTPKWIALGKLYYKGEWFKKTVPVELGFNTYTRSEYEGNLYDPVTQQFYLQGGDGPQFGNLNAYTKVDFYFIARIDKVRIFLKRTHLNQDGTDIGYFATPFYPGQKQLTDFGIRWLFFD